MITPERNCQQIHALLDRYIDREASADENSAVARHLEGCAECGRLLASRTALRERLRGAVRSGEIPAGLQTKIHERIAAAGRPHRLPWVPMALAAAVLLTVGLADWYRSGHMRLTPSSQEAYIESLAPRISPVMQVGLTQHVHCAVFRQYPSAQPSIEEMLRTLGPSYSSLLPAMQEHVPAEFHVVMAHLCARQGRQYVHVVARDGSRLISLLITRKGAGEAFENDLRAVAAEAGTPLYTSAVQRFSIAGFETRDHLVYLVSDLDAEQTLATLQAMAPQVRAALRET